MPLKVTSELDFIFATHPKLMFTVFSPKCKNVGRSLVGAFQDGTKPSHVVAYTDTNRTALISVYDEHSYVNVGLWDKPNSARVSSEKPKTDTQQPTRGPVA